MERRAFIKASMAFAAYCGVPAMASVFTRSAAAAQENVADGGATTFDYSVLQKMARSLASQPFGGPPQPLPQTLAELTPQAYNAIEYDHGHSLWHDLPNRQLDVELFHVGMGFKRRVRMYSVDADKHLAREIHFRPELFNYHDAGVKTEQLEGITNLGFAGFKVNKAPELTRRDVVSFLGASYFRAVEIPTSTVCRRVAWQWILLPACLKSSLISPHSGLIRQNRAIPPSRCTRCSMARASPALTASLFTASRPAW